MHERLLIVGAGDFGREVLCWALQVPAEQRTWEVGGFLDNRPGILDGYNLPAKIVGSPEAHVFEDRDRVVVAVGDPAQRRAFVEMVERRGAQFTTIIHPTVILGLNNTWGAGCIFCPGVIVTTNVHIGDHVICCCQSVAGHDAVVGSYCTLSGSVDITGHVGLGEGVFLGSHASVLPHVLVGDGAVVGAGSVVLRKVQPRSTVVGVPAREVCKKSDTNGSKSQLNLSIPLV